MLLAKLPPQAVELGRDAASQASPTGSGAREGCC